MKNIFKNRGGLIVILSCFVLLMACESNEEQNDQTLDLATDSLATNESPAKFVEDPIPVAIVEKSAAVQTMDSMTTFFELPYGPPEIRDVDFPKKWVSDHYLTPEVYGPDWDRTDSRKYDGPWTKISNFREWLSPLAEYQRKPIKPWLDLNIRQILDRPDSYYNNKFERSINPIPEDSLIAFRPAIRLPERYGFMVYGIGFNFHEGYASGSVSPLFITVRPNGEIVDVLSTYGLSRWVRGFFKYAFVDENYVFHVRNFFSEEGIEISCTNYEKWQINENGRFIRYYDRDGSFKSEYEEGQVLNHRREGKWTEYKLNEEFEYGGPKTLRQGRLEAYFENGLAQGEWKYYNSFQNTKSEMKLHMFRTEVYEKGILVERSIPAPKMKKSSAIPRMDWKAKLQDPHLPNLNRQMNGFFDYMKRDLTKEPFALDYEVSPEHFEYYDVGAVGEKVKLDSTVANIRWKVQMEAPVDVYLIELEVFEDYWEDDIVLMATYDAKGKLIDAMPVNYSIGIQHNSSRTSKLKKFTDGYIHKLFFIDEQSIVHTYFIDNEYWGDSDTLVHVRNEQWQIHENGQFVRYYDKDVPFHNSHESGRVKNHRRIGHWIEVKPNERVGEITFLDAYYDEDGLAHGEWKYFSLDTDHGFKARVLLLYTESYQDGKLLERKFE